MAQITVQQITTAGITPVLSPADVAGDNYPFQERTFLYVANGDAAPHTVTIAAQWEDSELRPGTQKKDIAVVIPAGEDRFIGPIDKNAYSDASDLVQITYDGVTNVTVAAVRL